MLFTFLHSSKKLDLLIKHIPFPPKSVNFKDRSHLISPYEFGNSTFTVFYFLPTTNEEWRANWCVDVILWGRSRGTFDLIRSAWWLRICLWTNEHVCVCVCVLFRWIWCLCCFLICPLFSDCRCPLSVERPFVVAELMMTITEALLDWLCDGAMRSSVPRRSTSFLNSE